MIPLALDLDTADFDRLLAIAKARLPALAPAWTDYNHHDPGVMLIELLAWLADSQIYSLSRNRRDERLGFLSLMGGRARGARPARGLVFPAATPDATSHIARGAVLKPARGGAPRLEADAEMTLLPVSIKHIATVGPAGMRDVTAINALARAAFSAFGAGGRGALKIELDVGPAAPKSGEALLSLGFRLAGAPPEGATQRFGRVGAYGKDGARLHRTRDTTLGLQRSGAMIFRLDAERLAEPIELRVERGYALNPRLLSVTPNALPVEQRASLVHGVRGLGRPGQSVEIVPGELFPADEAGEKRVWRLLDGAAALRVDSLTRQGPLAWTRGRLDEAGPHDARYAAEEAPDGSRIALRFGNGVNGRRPSVEEPLTVALVLSCGRGGRIAQPADWILTPAGVRWRNAEPIAGAADPQSPDDALADLREQLAERRPLATSVRLAQAALALPGALGVGRAEVEDGWERGRRSPAVAATRTLVVASVDPGAETPDWLAAIRRRLAPRAPVGERLLVVAPRWRRFTLAVAVVAIPGARPAAVAAAVREALAARFDPANRRPWPFGRDLSAAAFSGWARKVAGVACVLSVEIRPEGGAATARLAIGRGEAPLLVGEPSVTVEGRTP